MVFLVLGCGCYWFLDFLFTNNNWVSRNLCALVCRRSVMFVFHLRICWSFSFVIVCFVKPISSGVVRVFVVFSDEKLFI